MRYSKQRELILNAVLNNKVHPTADFVYNFLKEDNPELSLGTVYRNLNFLAENNMLKKSVCLTVPIVSTAHLQTISIWYVSNAVKSVIYVFRSLA